MKPVAYNPQEVLISLIEIEKSLKRLFKRIVQRNLLH